MKAVLIPEFTACMTTPARAAQKPPAVVQDVPKARHSRQGRQS